MTKGKITMSITIGLLSAMLTAVIFIQFKTIDQTDIPAIQTMQEEEIKTEIAELKTKYNETQDKINDTNKMIQSYQEKTNSGKQASELLKTELEEADSFVGRIDVKGNGVVITLTDAKDSKIVALDLIGLLNELKTAGAEAISINGQRIIYNSHVADIEEKFISVNGPRLISPYVIKVIGNQDEIYNTLEKGYIPDKQAKGKSITATKENNITINKFKGDIQFEYIKK